mgnify:CR=1 FL=1
MKSVVPLLTANTTGFDCGDGALNRWLHRYAKQNEANNFSRTHVLVDGQTTLGFYTLSASSIDLTARDFGSANAPDPIPAILLGRMAVSLEHQAQGNGKLMLVDALEKTQAVTEKAGVAVMLVHPKASAIDYYLRFGFHRMPGHDALWIRI